MKINRKKVNSPEELRSMPGLIQALESAGVTEAAVFGSTARGTATEQSDVDILVQFEKPIGLFGLSALQDQLQDILKRSVDLVTYNSLHPLIREQALKDKRIIYEKF